jgi:hypothetical protein
MWLALAGAPVAQAAAIDFAGRLDVIAVDEGGALFSGVALGTPFSGTIDDVTANGQVGGGGRGVSFGCCIAAGALSVTNDRVLPADDAALINALLGADLYQEGDVVDIVDLEGDVQTASGGRIEVGLSYLFDASTFADASPGNYPFDPTAVRASLFFVLEQDAAGEDIYHGLGKLTGAPPPIPEPASGLLLLAGLGALAAATRRAR